MTSSVWFRVRLLPQLRLSFLKSLEELSKISQLGVAPQIEDIHVPYRECTITFPEGSVEGGNILQQLSVLLGFLTADIFSEIEILDGTLPPLIGKVQDRQSLRKKLQAPDRPLSAARIPKSHGRTPTACLEAAYHLFSGGTDLVMDHPALTSFSHHAFEERIAFLSEEEKKQTSLKKGKKWYVPNITARSIFEMERRCAVAKEHELKIVGVESALIGLGALASLGLITADHDLILLSLPEPECLLLPCETKAFVSKAFSTMIKNSLGVNIVARSETTAHKSFLPLIFGLHELADLEDRVKKMGHDVVLDGSHIIEHHPEGLQAGARAFQKALKAADQGIEFRPISSKPLS